jgi:hypothetical protein
MAKQTTTAPPTSGLPAQASLNNMLSAQNGLPQPTPSSVDQGPSATNGQAVNPLGALFAGMSNGVQNQNQNQAQNVTTQNPLASLLPQAQVSAIPQAAPLGQDAQQQFQLIQLMAAQGIPPDQWGTALQLLALQGANAQSNVGGAPNFAPPLTGANGWAGQSRDQQAPEYLRSPPSQYRRRSRSPNWERRRDPSPPRRRDSPVYGDYRGDATGRNREDRGGRRGNDYRQRSPTGRRRRTPTPPPKDVPLPPPGVKNVQYDPTIGKGNIKVLSRTLFVGGVTSSEAHLRSLFSNFGVVQTCIVNVDKRHAFVKMIDRKDAIAARDGMEQYKSGDMQLRVGIPPTMLSAPFTNKTYRRVGVLASDQEIAATIRLVSALFPLSVSLTPTANGCSQLNMEVLEVVPSNQVWSSKNLISRSELVSLQKVCLSYIKNFLVSPFFAFLVASCSQWCIVLTLILLLFTAISRRMATDQGGKRGPQSSRGGNHGSSRPSDRPRFTDDHDRPTSSDNTNPNTTAPPSFPGYNFSFQNLPNGMQMPMFPPGFMMPGMPQQTGSGSGS